MKLFIAALFALSLVACNGEDGPETGVYSSGRPGVSIDPRDDIQTHQFGGLSKAEYDRIFAPKH